MKRHDLLFRYLDGEITRDEDKILRELIKEDPELGEDFESFLEIDYHINKSNAEFNYPQDFINQVGNQISNQIAVDNQVRQLRNELRRKYATRFVLVPAIFATLFFAFLISIQNPEIDFLAISSNNSDYSKIAKNNLNIEKEKISLKKPRKGVFQNKNNLTPPSLPSLSKSLEIINNSESDNSEIYSDNLNSSDVTIEYDAEQDYHSSVDVYQKVDKPQFTQLEDAINPTNFKLNKSQLNNTSINNLLNEQFTVNPKLQNINLNPFQSSFISQSNIQINSLVGTDIYQVGVSSTNQIINSFTQSFAAEITSGSSLGLEAGYIQFKSNAKKITEISSKPVKNGLNGLTILELDNNSDNNPVLIRVEGIQSINHKMFWVGVFYERNFLELNDFNVSTRVSFGISDNGVISSLKLIGKYNLTKGIILTFGSDAKIFEGSFNENQINRINSTFSLIYGIKFAF